MDDKSLDLLEFSRIRELVAAFASFSASRDLALALLPSPDHQLVSLLLRQTTEARRLLALEPDFSIRAVTDIRELSRLAARGRILEPKELLEIQDTLASARSLRDKLEELSDEAPLLWSIAVDIVSLPGAERDIEHCISPSAEVLDSASPTLATIREDLRRAHDQLLNHLDGIIRSPRGRRILQEPLVTQREGRYVLPVKIEHRREMKGIVHDISNTGVTVFMEPWSALDLGNELRELAAQERAELERILQKLSAEVGVHEEEIALDIGLIAELDLALAKARYARRARATEATVTAGEEGGEQGYGCGAATLRLRQARHPLLGDKAVPLSVEIGGDFSTLVITGPNTGGKTVALKTIGLLSAMTQAGLPIPAAPESCVPVFDSIFADIGDEQSIEQTLSTFSWHISNMVRIIEGAGRRSLVLLDELGTSTDPIEGSALARAVLTHLLDHGVMTVATTHFSDLKTFAYATPGMQNAALEFDPATLAPTYHLTVGVPGGSNALATASRLGLPAGIVEAAQNMLPEGEQAMERLLSVLMNEKKRIEELRADLEQQQEQAEQKNAELDQELIRSREEQRSIIRETRDAVLRDAAELHREIRQAGTELRKKRSKEGVEQARKTVQQVAESLKTELWQAPVEEGAGELPDEGAIAPGDTVRLKEARIEATVLSVSEKKQQLELQVGQTRLWVGPDSVDKVSASPAGPAARTRVVTRDTGRGRPPLELDLRGKRADEVEPALDVYLNDASLANLGEVRIIHGIGTGTVREIVRDFISSHPLVKSFRPGEKGEGGAGVTVARL